jgi:hypothetical protein
MLIIPPAFPITIEMAFKTMPITDIVTVAVQAHPMPFSKPYGNNERYNPIATIILPITIAPLPISGDAIPERYMLEPTVKLPLLKADSRSEGRTVVRSILHAARSVIPPKSIITPPIMLRIAIIVTPMGRDLGVDCNPFPYGIDCSQIL